MSRLSLRLADENSYSVALIGAFAFALRFQPKLVKGL
jgi:hypothetical protein